MATRKMEVSEAVILLAVDGSSLFLAHKAGLQMRFQAVLRVPRRTNRRSMAHHSMEWKFCEATGIPFPQWAWKLWSFKHRILVFSQDAAPSPHLGLLHPREAWNVRERPVGKSRSPLTSKLATREKNGNRDNEGGMKRGLAQGPHSGGF